MANFTIADFIISGIFFLSILMGLSRGLFKEIISLVTVIVAFIVAIKFSTPLSNFLMNSQGASDVVATISKYFGVDSSGPLGLFTLGLSFLLIFAGVYCVGEALSYVSKVVQIIPGMAVVDHLLGGAVGFLKGGLFNIVLVLLVQLTPLAQNDAWTQSQLVPKIQPYAQAVANYIQPGLQMIKSNSGQAVQNMTNNVMGH